MQTFNAQPQVRSIDEILASTLYVQAKNAEIEELQWELASQREAWLEINADKDAQIAALEAELQRLRDADSLAGLVRELAAQPVYADSNFLSIDFGDAIIRKLWHGEWRVWSREGLIHLGQDEAAAVRAFREAAAL